MLNSHLLINYYAKDLIQISDGNMNYIGLNHSLKNGPFNLDLILDLEEPLWSTENGPISIKLISGGVDQIGTMVQLFKFNNGLKKENTFYRCTELKDVVMEQ